MKETKLSIFQNPWLQPFDAICIPTNGIISSTTGRAIMGKGVALQAKNRWPEIDQELANAIEKFGNVPCFLGTVDLGDRLSPDPYGIGYQVWSFPTKNHWRDPSSLDLIGKSCKILVEKIDKWNQQNPKVGITSVGMPRPGVGLGGLDWLQVRYVISKILDDRFTICTL